MHVHRLVVVMPAYNEREGLPGFLAEIERHLAARVADLRFVVVDDVSTDGTGEVLRGLGMPGLTVVTAPRNRGHGPTALAAYRAGLAAEPDALLHVDGDGEFRGEDFPRLVHGLESTGADVIHGVRRGRDDPWYRRTLTGLVGMGTALAVGRRIPDVNTPLRAYRPAALERLLAVCPDDALVPHVHFSLAERRLGLDVRYVAVRSRPRRGSASVGTMWGSAPTAPALPPKRLLAFSASAAAEVWRTSLRRRRVPAPGDDGAPEPGPERP